MATQTDVDFGYKCLISQKQSTTQLLIWTYIKLWVYMSDFRQKSLFQVLKQHKGCFCVMATDEESYLKPVMTPVAWVAGIWLTALDLHLSHKRVKTERIWNNFRFKPTTQYAQIGLFVYIWQESYIETSPYLGVAGKILMSMPTSH